MKSTDVIGRSAHALLSLPNAVLAPLAGPRPTIDGQRLTPRLQLLANGGKRALAGLSFPPTALERRFDAVGQWLTLAHGDDASWRDLSACGNRHGCSNRWNRRRAWWSSSTAVDGSSAASTLPTAYVRSSRKPLG